MTDEPMRAAWLHEQAKVTCRWHGPMHHDFARDSYVCHGFDGEGCERYLSAEELLLIGLMHEIAQRFDAMGEAE